MRRTKLVWVEASLMGHAVMLQRQVPTLYGRYCAWREHMHVIHMYASCCDALTEAAKLQAEYQYQSVVARCDKHK